jgi:hypothetical protein
MNQMSTLIIEDNDDRYFPEKYGVKCNWITEIELLLEQFSYGCLLFLFL